MNFKVRPLFFLPLFSSLFLSFPFPLYPTPLRVTFINVGQGDSTLIETPSGQNILIDGGDKDQGTDKIVPLLNARGISTIQKMILTHSHADHYNGLADILSDPQFSVGTFYHSETFAELNATIRNAVNASTAAGRVTNIVRITTSATPSLDFGPDLTAKVLHADMKDSNPNNNSIVIKLTYNQISFLLSGDIEIIGSTNVIKNFSSLLPSTIVKVPHHGSKTGLDFSVNFPGRINAKVGTVSASGGTFGLPDPEMIAAYESIGTKVFRTDKSGNIVVTTDGISYSVATSVVDAGIKGLESVSNLRVYPNPVKTGRGTIAYSLNSKADSVKVKIFTVSGELVRTLDGLNNPGSNFVEWDGNNQDGNKTASGLYVATVEAKQGTASVFNKTRFAVLKK